MKSAGKTILACLLMTFVLGSMHAFSVFLEPLEMQLNASRSQISSIYSIALVFLTIAVLVGYKFYTLISTPILAALSCIGAALGLFIAGQSTTFLGVLIGYAVFFGIANGVGYGFALQLSAQAMPQRKGFAMGAVTAFYALGAAATPSLYQYGLQNGGFSYSMNLASGLLLVAGYSSLFFT